MNRYDVACEQSAAFLALVGELSASGLELPDLPAIAALSEQHHQALVALGAAPGAPSTPGADMAHEEAWLALCRKLNKQVRLLDEALGALFLSRAGAVLEQHREDVAAAEAALAREALADGAVEPLDGPDPAGRALREAIALREAWPIELLELFAWRSRVRRARLGRKPAGFTALEQLLTDMGQEVPHVLDVSGLLADLHRKRTWEVGFYPVLDVQGALLDAIDLAFHHGVTKLATSAPKKASTALASGLQRLAAYRARAEAITDLALHDGAEAGEAAG